MPIEVTDIVPEATAAPEQVVAEEAAPQEEEAPLEASAEAPEARCAAPSAPAPKKRGRPPGSKNKPKPPSEVVSEAVSEVVSEVAPAASLPKVKAKPKAKPAAAPAESVRMKRAAPKRVPPPVYESESEEEAPLSPMSQRRAQWAAYRQAQVDAHQARVSHYSKALDRMLAF